MIVVTQQIMEIIGKGDGASTSQPIKHRRRWLRVASWCVLGVLFLLLIILVALNRHESENSATPSSSASAVAESLLSVAENGDATTLQQLLD